MNVSLNWLKEYVDLDENLSVKDIIDKLTMTGTKVEKVETFGQKTQDVYTAKVQKIEKHEQDESLYILTLNMEDKGTLKAVAKIPDIELGNIVPVALPGAKVIGKEIKVGEVKGVKSECMVCHILDLGLNSKDFPWVKPSGLITFPKDTVIGEDVNEVLGLGDSIIEFEITPNRPDCLSVEGIARELAVSYGKEYKSLWQDKATNLNIVDKVDNMSVKIESTNCKRYMLNVIDNIKIESSPCAMQLKLIKSGIRPINNIVDITNYVMLEVGQPVHAFDYRNINSNQIIVRQAKKSEAIETLDEAERSLDENNLVIADDKKILAIAGVMGGNQSSVLTDTSKIVLEVANFVRGSIRNTSRKICLRTEASSRYEKGLPEELVPHAMVRLCNLISEILKIDVKLNVVDNYSKKQNEVKVYLDYKRVNNIIGLDIDEASVNKILVSLGFRIENGYAIPPYYRQDVEIIEDIAEEIARINGYEKINSNLPVTDLTFGSKTYEQKVQDQMKNVAMSNGYSEIYTYTFFSKDLLDRMLVEENSILRDCVKVSNPLSQDFEYMRTTAAPLMLEALERNYTKKNYFVKLFELGKVFLNDEKILKGELGKEKLTFTLGMYDSENTLDYYNLKETVEDILGYFKILENDYEIKRINNSLYHPGISAQIVINNEVVATFGKISPKVISNYILPENTYVAQIDFENVLKYAKKEVTYTELPKYPAVERDLAFVISKDVLSHDIIRSIKCVNKEIIESVELFDVYEGKQIEEGKKSMAYRIRMRSKEKTLEENEINNTMEKIMKELEDNYKAVIRK
jgi:phenylalanyl-tRNA synthetase beta chain